MNKIKAAFIILFFFSLSGPRLFAEEPLTWQDCARESAKNNPDLISASEAIKRQKAAKFSTQSGLLPQVTGSVDASRTETTTSASSSAIKNSFSYGVDGAQLIFDGFQTINNINAAAENERAAKENYRYVSSQVQFDLRSAFANLLKAQELINVAEDILSTSVQ